MPPHESLETVIWIAALESALERARCATTHRERLDALEAVEEARERLGVLLDAVRDAILAPDRDAHASQTDAN